VIKALKKIEVITLFVEDLPPVKVFYQDVFGLEVVYQDDVSAAPAWLPGYLAVIRTAVDALRLGRFGQRAASGIGALRA